MKPRKVYVLSGFDGPLDGAAAWEPDETFADLESAVSAAKAWVKGNDGGARVLVIDLSARVGHAIRVVTPSRRSA